MYPAWWKYLRFGSEEGLVTWSWLMMTPKCRLCTADSNHMKKPVRTLKNQKNCQHKNTVAGANAGIQRVVCHDCGRVSLIEFREAVTYGTSNAEGSSPHN